MNTNVLIKTKQKFFDTYLIFNPKAKTTQTFINDLCKTTTQVSIKKIDVCLKLITFEE